MDACCAIKLSSTPKARAEDARSNPSNVDKPSGHQPVIKLTERERKHLDATANRLALGGLACGALTFVNATVCFPIAGALVNDFSARLALTTVPVLVPLVGAGLLTWAAMRREGQPDTLGQPGGSNQPRATARRVGLVRLVGHAGEDSERCSDNIVGSHSSIVGSHSSIVGDSRSGNTSNGSRKVSSETDSDVLVDLPSTSNSDSSDSSDNSDSLDRSWT